MDEITPAMLRTWWGNEVEALVEKKRRGELVKAPKRDPQTGRHYINVLQAIFAYAIELGLVTASPVSAFRTILQRHQRTKRGRAAKDPAQKIRPLSVEAMDRVVAAARAEGPEDLVVTLLCLDAGLRLGEAIGLTWGGVVPGADEMDATRHLYLDEQSNRPRGRQAGPPKSGRTRTVALSRRLRAALLELERRAFRPSPSRRVLDGVDPSNWRKRQWRRICADAGVGHRAIKDLRDTNASQLLTGGVQLGYVSVQLGHSDVSVTANHYARWAGGDQYRAPVPLLPGEVPADLLARLGAVSAERQ